GTVQGYGAGAGMGAASPALPSAPLPAADERPWARGVSADRQDRALALFTTGNGALQDGDAARAIASYRQALARWNHPAIHYNLAVALLQQGDRDQAAAELRAALAYPAALGADKTATAKKQLAQLAGAPP
ncbi:MAG TPA: tetratricopeptide repeat protein, partial [Kofleriaceae bacterium]|nr:tetratricopeptide repeat protein [Kofleriaceae bacterium]